MADINLTLGVDVSDAESQLNGFNRTVQSAFNSSNTHVNKMGVSLSKVVQDIQRTTSRMREISTIRIENPQLQSTDSAIQQITADLDRARMSQQRLFITGQTNTQAYTDATLQVQGLEMELQRAVTYRDQLMSQPTQVVDNTQSEEYRAMSDHLSNCVNQANILTHGINQSMGATSKLGKAVAVLKTLWHSVVGAVNKFRSTLSKTGNSHNMTFKKMLTSVLKYVFGIRSVFLAYRKLRQVIKEGLNSMAKQFPEIATQVNSLNNAWWGFKSSIVSAFQPIFSYVVPALVTLINYLTSAMNTLANFFAVLTGQGYYYKAVKGNKDVAKSVGGTGSAAKKANEELAEYDKLLVIDQKDSGGGGGGGGGSSDDSGFNWVKETTESNDFIESLKKAWAEGDWEGLGQIISQKLTDMMNSIPWDSIYAKAKDFGTNLAKFLNGLINPELFSALGTTIANALTTALIFLQSFGETFNWENLGNSIASGINAFFKNFQFSQLAQTFNTWANGILTALITAIQNIDFKAIAQNIADGIGALDAEGIMWKVGTLVTSLAQAIIDFASNNELWANLGTKIAEGINGFLKGFDIGKALTAVGTVAAGILNAIATAMQKVEWDTVGSKVVQGLKGIFTDIPWDKVVGGIGSLVLASIKSQFSFTLGMAEEIISSLSAWFKSIGLDSVAGFLDGIGEKIKTAKEFITGTFDLIISWVKSFFGIASPSTVFAEIGGFLIEGLKQGLLTAVTAIGTWLKTNVVDKILDGVKAVTEITATIKGFIDDTFTKAKEKFDEIKGAVGEAWSNIKGKVEDTFTKAKEKFDEVKGAVGEAISNIKGEVKESFTNAKAKFDEVKNATGEAISNIKGELKESFTTAKKAFDDIKSATGEALANIKGETQKSFDEAKKAFDNIKSAVGTAKATITGFVENSFNTAKTTFDTLKNVTASAKSTLIGAVDGTFTSAQTTFNTLSGVVATAKASLIGEAQKSFNDAKKSFNDMKGAVAKALVKLEESGWSTVSAWVKGKMGSDAVNKAIGLANTTWKSVTAWVKDNFGTGSINKDIGLKQAFKVAGKTYKTVTDWVKANLGKTVIEVGVKLKEVGSNLWNKITGKGKSSGRNGAPSNVPGATGGVVQHGRIYGIPQYAGGTLNAGSMFIAGEAGPEVIGHIKGRTEVLNASQLASAMRASIIDGMMAVLNSVKAFNFNLDLSKLGDIPPIPVIVTGQLLPLTEAFMFKFEEQHKDFEDVKLRLDDIIRRLSDGSNKEPIMLQLDGRTIVELVWDETQKRYKQTGKTMFA